MEATIRLNRELAYTGVILKIYRDTVVANGIRETYDFIHHDGAAAVLPVTKDGKLMLVRQYRNALDRPTLELPAGAKDRMCLQRAGGGDRIPHRKAGVSDDIKYDSGFLRRGHRCVYCKRPDPFQTEAGCR